MSHKMGKGKERRRSQLNGNTTGETKAQQMKQNNGQFNLEFGQDTTTKPDQMTQSKQRTNQTPYKNNYQNEFSAETVTGTAKPNEQKISKKANLKTDRYDLEFGEDSSLRGTGMVPQKHTTTQKVNNKKNLKTDQYKYEFGTENSTVSQTAKKAKQNYQEAEKQYSKMNNNYTEEYAKESGNPSKYQTSTKNYNAANRYKEEFGSETFSQGYGQSSGYMQNRGMMKSSLPSNKYNEEYGQGTYGTRANKNLANRKSKVRTPAYGESYNYDEIASTYKRGASKNYNVEFGSDNMTNHSAEFNYKKDGISAKANEMANRYTEEYGLEGPEANPRNLKEKMQSDEYVGKSQRGLYNTSKNYKTEFANESPKSMFTAGKQVAAEKFKQKFQDDLQQNYNVEIASENLIKKDDRNER